MRFKYKRINASIIRPIIPVTLSNKNLVIRYESLVDSGSDICIFPSALCGLLNINRKSGRKDEFIGVTGKDQTVYYHTVGIEIGGYKVPAEVGFADVTSYGYGFVGQKGFFNKFIVKFHYRKAVVDVTPEPGVH